MDLINVSNGYALQFASAGDLIFNGTLITGNYFGGINAGSMDGFNLVGNPYTAYVNSTTLANLSTTALAEETVWLWNGSGYVTYNVVNPIEIAPGQGFFVEANATGGNLVFDTVNRSRQGRNTFLKQESKVSFELSIVKGTSKSLTKVFYVDGKTTRFDNGYDSKMFGATTYDLAVYTELVTDNVGDKLAIQILPTENSSNLVIPVGGIGKANEEINFSVTSLNLPEGTNIYLEDKVNNKFVNLSESTYRATLTQDTNNTGQFYVHTSAKSLSTDDITNLSTLSIYKSDTNEITISGLNELAKVSLYSLLGEEVFTTNIISKGTHKVNIPAVSAGVYIVKLASETADVTKK